MFKYNGIPDKTSITLEETMNLLIDDSNVLAAVLSRKQYVRSDDPYDI